MEAFAHNHHLGQARLWSQGVPYSTDDAAAILEAYFI